MGHREELATGRSGPQGVVGHREEWVTGRSGPQAGVGHRQEWATGRSVPQGGVCHKEEWATRSEFCVNLYRIIILLFTLHLFQIEQSSFNCAFQFFK